MRDPSRREDAKNLGIVYGTGAVAALLTAVLLLKASPAPVMEVVVEAAPDPVPVIMPEPAAEPIVPAEPIQTSGDNRLYGTVTTITGRRYEGYVRWDRNEGSWADLLDANKQPDHGNDRVVRTRRVPERARDARKRARSLRERARDGDRDRDGERSFKLDVLEDLDDLEHVADLEDLSRIAIAIAERSRESRAGAPTIVISGRSIRSGILQSFSFGTSATQSGIRFGHLKSIAALDSRTALFTLKSGEEMVFSANATDLGSNLRALVVEQVDGDVIELAWGDLDVVEFEAAPEDASPPSSRNYGTMTTHSGLEFTGYITWDVDEIYSSDILNGDDGRDDREIPFGSIERIDRDSSRGAMVTLDTGEEVLLSGTNDVDESNNGISVSDPGLGQVKVNWYDFASVRFHEAESQAGYGQFDGGQAIFGTVKTKNGGDYTGEIVWDLDESYTWEMLNGEQDGVEFHVEFSKIASLRPISSWGTKVTLKDGRTYELRGSNDVDHSNRGILVRLENGDEVQVEWDDLEEVRLQNR
ncbi:MAG: hypothetical protein BMS9Abin29_1125 [Gemmatimonadota bacterium]|nr:MAG: hypothetical protein BMS9Abin29_1125 [Gemmatimonadota bacterium]